MVNGINKFMKNDKQSKWHNRRNEGVCLQRDSLDLYIDNVLVASAPINHESMEKLKKQCFDNVRSGILYQIKIRDSVQWESIPTQIEDEPNNGWPRVYDEAVM